MLIVTYLLLLSLRESISLNPVLLVPGDVASQMQARYTKSPPHFICGEKHKWFNIWLNIEYFLPIHPLLDCLVKTMRMEYNPVNGTTRNPEFCDLQVPGFGTIDTIQYFNVYKIKKAAYFVGIIKSLVTNFGYTANKNLLGAPYDFRKGPNEMRSYLEEVRLLIERMWADNGGRPVIVMAHSMGNLHMVRLFNSVSQKWKDKYIKTFISISAPYSGAVKSVYGIFTGYKVPVPYIRPEQLQPILITWPSTYYLFPSPSTWSQEVIVKTKFGNFTSKNITDLLRLSKIENAVEHYKDVVDNIVNISAPHVPMHCIYSVNMPTYKMLDYSATRFPLSHPTIIYGNGDGTVNLESLQQCVAWRAHQTHRVDEHVVPSVSHLDIMNADTTLEIINIIMHETLRDY